MVTIMNTEFEISHKELLSLVMVQGAAFKALGTICHMDAVHGSDHERTLGIKHLLRVFFLEIGF